MNTNRHTSLLAFFLALLASFILGACNSGSSSTTTINTRSGMKSFVQFSIANPAASGIINESAKTIAVTVPFGTNVTALAANFTDTGVAVSVGGVAQTSGTTTNDFTSPVKYVVTAEDGTTAIYTATVTTAANSAKAITAFSFASPAATGVINEFGKSITVTVPSGTNVTALVANFTTTGASVKVGATAQTSGTTANNFSNAVLYRVTAADSSFVDYTVSVIVAPSSAKAITSFSFPTLNDTGTINEAAKTITVNVLSGTNLNGLVASFATSGISVSVGGVVQVSGTTISNFTNPITYTVTAADGSIANYTVTVILGIPGINWTARTSGTTNNLLSVTWSGTQYVAVGSLGTILTSPDGVTWTARTSGTTNNLLSVTWSGTQYVAVGSLGTILTSPDGVTWTVRTSGTTNPLLGITWSGTQFVVVGGPSGLVGAQATILTSPDGVTWTARTSGTTNWLNGVTWSGTQFVAVGSSGSILTSPDGVIWTPRTSGTLNPLSGITWSGTQFVAVGSSGSILTSPDGVAWTPHLSGTANQLTGVTWSGTQFVITAVGWVGTLFTSPDILTSPDAVTWTPRVSGATSQLNSVTGPGTQFVAVGNWSGAGTFATIVTSP